MDMTSGEKTSRAPRNAQIDSEKARLRDKPPRNSSLPRRYVSAASPFFLRLSHGHCAPAYACPLFSRRGKQRSVQGPLQPLPFFRISLRIPTVQPSPSFAAYPFHSQYSHSPGSQRFPPFAPFSLQKIHSSFQHSAVPLHPSQTSTLFPPLYPFRFLRLFRHTKTGDSLSASPISVLHL